MDKQPIKSDLSKAVEVLCKELAKERKENEGGYYFGWQSNIAMAFYDEYFRQFSPRDKIRPLIHEIANNAAKNFLDLLIRDAKNDYPDD